MLSAQLDSGATRLPVEKEFLLLPGDLLYLQKGPHREVVKVHKSRRVLRDWAGQLDFTNTGYQWPEGTHIVLMGNVNERPE